MNRNVHRQLTEERGVDIREPSTANLFIDSLDRNIYNYSSSTSQYGPSGQILNPQIGILRTGYLYEYASNFTINSLQNQSLGHFTRMAVQEVSMRWGIPNINIIYNDNAFKDSSAQSYADVQYDNTFFKINITGGSANPYTIRIPIGFYTVSQVLNQLVIKLNALNVGGAVFSVSGDAVYGAKLVSTVGVSIPFSPLAQALGFQHTASSGYATSWALGVVNPVNIMPWTYVDITCNNLTYCQDVKDATTNFIKKDVLYRWYLNWDNNSPQVDSLGFPILEGYQPFACTRLIPFPKQIKWDPIQQIGNLRFISYAGFNSGEGYDEYGGVGVQQQDPCANFDNLLPTNTNYPLPYYPNYEFQMTLLLSEV